MDNEWLLFDRVEKIKQIINQYGEDNFYISFSGGKDSTILHHLVDMALPDNKIPRVFSNTGIEYNMILEFVKDQAINDSRFKIIYPKKNIKNMLENVGYPFKSKQHSHIVGIFQRSGKSLSVRKYLKEVEGNNVICCPKKLQYQFTDNFNIKLSDKCCYELKKKPFKQWEKENNKTIAITGMRTEEGGQRMGMNCIVMDKDKKIIKFHPLSVVSNEWEEWFIKKIQYRTM